MYVVIAVLKTTDTRCKNGTVQAKQGIQILTLSLYTLSINNFFLTAISSDY